MSSRLAPPSYTRQDSSDRSAEIVSPSYLPGAGRKDRPILPCEEWLKSKYYTGGMWDQFWREDVRREFCEIVDDPAVEEIVLDGSIGWGKSFWMRAFVLRVVYELSTRANPGAYFLGNPNSTISIALMSVKQEKSRAVLFDNLRNTMESIPYFQRECRFNDEWDTARLQTQIKFTDFNVVVKPVVTNIGAVISDDLFTFVLDEGNFLPKVKDSKRALDAESASRADGGVWSAAREFAKKARTRIRSRFLKNGRCWGKMLIGSSAIDDGDFTEERRKEAEEAGELGTRVRYIRRSLWEGKPPGTFGDATFDLDLGRRGRPPRILSAGEVPIGEVIQVPEELRTDFVDDPVLATRELAGRRSAPRNVWLGEETQLNALWDKMRPDPCATTQLSGELTFDRSALVVRTRSGLSVPILYPSLPRVLHLDLSSTGDRTGVAMGCAPGFDEFEVRDHENGGLSVVRVPRLHVDLALAVVPPRGGMIDLIEVEEFVMQLIAAGFDIRLVTFDQFQSNRSLQTFEQSGISSKYLSVDRMPDPYQLLRRILRRGCASAPYNDVLESELTNLSEDASTGKVDHPPRGSKDVSDALASISYALVHPDYLQWALERGSGSGGCLPSLPM